jgi:hypothetical protein
MEHTAYIFMGSEVGLLDELFKNPAQMPFGLAVPLNMGAPDAAAWKKYITARFREFKVSLTAAEIDELLDFCGGHPRDLMELCEHLLTVRSLNPDISGTLEIAKKRTLNSLRPQFDEIWKRLEKPTGSQITATRIANHLAIYGPGRPHKSVARTLEKLEREGVIHKVARGNYEFTEPLFGYYVRELGD